MQDSPIEIQLQHSGESEQPKYDRPASCYRPEVSSATCVSLPPGKYLLLQI